MNFASVTEAGLDGYSHLSCVLVSAFEPGEVEVDQVGVSSQRRTSNVHSSGQQWLHERWLSSIGRHGNAVLRNYEYGPYYGVLRRISDFEIRPYVFAGV
jgi:hypothetical protein